MVSVEKSPSSQGRTLLMRNARTNRSIVDISGLRTRLSPSILHLWQIPNTPKESIRGNPRIIGSRSCSPIVRILERTNGEHKRTRYPKSENHSL